MSVSSNGALICERTLFGLISLKYSWFYSQVPQTMLDEAVHYIPHVILRYLVILFNRDGSTISEFHHFKRLEGTGIFILCEGGWALFNGIRPMIYLLCPGLP